MCPTVILSIGETLAPTVRALPLRPATYSPPYLRLTGFSTYLVSFPVFPSLVLLIGGSAAAALIPHHLSINGPSLPPPPTPPKSTYRSSCLLLAALLFPFLSLFDHTSAAFSASIRSIHPSFTHSLDPSIIIYRHKSRFIYSRLPSSLFPKETSLKLDVQFELWVAENINLKHTIFESCL